MLTFTIPALLLLMFLAFLAGAIIGAVIIYKKSMVEGL